MSSLNYERYNLDELHDVLENIDREKWPDRVAQVEGILNDPKRIKRLRAARLMVAAIVNAGAKWTVPIFTEV